LFLAFYEFVEKFIRQVKEYQEVKEIPRSRDILEDLNLSKERKRQQPLDS